MAEYLDSFLTPLSTRHPSYIRDTKDFVHRIRRMRIEELCFLFTMDVNSLYTNIDIPLGMAAVRKWLLKYPDINRPDTELLELLHLSLTRNDFLFDEQYYLQIKGTAMGKRFAPAYANIYMADWEATAFTKCKKVPTQYVRYLDDIWGIWSHSHVDFLEFVHTLNSHHESIKLDPSTDHTQVHFLDTTTFKGPDFGQTGVLDTKVYFKPTDTHALLHRQSFHPQHVFKGILKSQLLRFQRICSRQVDRDQAVHTLFHTLRRRGYSWSFLQQLRKKVYGPPTATTLDTRQLIPLVSVYSKYSLHVNRKLKINFNKELENTTIPGNFKVISAYQKSPTLKDLLVRAKLHPLKM